MNIAITAVGSRGGLQPYVAFGIGVRHAFHEVLFASSRNDGAFVRVCRLGISRNLIQNDDMPIPKDCELSLTSRPF